MAGMQGGFNAQQYEPKQGGFGIHPVGRYPAKIVGTEIKSNAANTGGYFQVDFETPAGVIVKRYNMWNTGDNAQKTIEIANGELSALCHATGRYQVNWQDEGAALRGADLMIEVGFQRLSKEQQEKKDRGETVEPYTEIKKVLDRAGNEPGKANTGTAPQTQQAQNQSNPANNAPLTSQQGGGWSQQSGQAQQTEQQPQGSGWQGGATQQQPNQNNASAANSGQSGAGWQQQPQNGNGGNAVNPPWASRNQ